MTQGGWPRPEAAQRVHTLSQGFPFYAHTLARDTTDLVRGSDDDTAGRVLGEHVDAAFQRQCEDSWVGIFAADNRNRMLASGMGQ